MLTQCTKHVCLPHLAQQETVEELPEGFYWLLGGPSACHFEDLLGGELVCTDSHLCCFARSVNKSCWCFRMIYLGSDE